MVLGSTEGQAGEKRVACSTALTYLLPAQGRESGRACASRRVEGKAKVTSSRCWPLPTKLCMVWDHYLHSEPAQPSTPVTKDILWMLPHTEVVVDSSFKVSTQYSPAVKHACSLKNK